MRTFGCLTREIGRSKLSEALAGVGNYRLETICRPIKTLIVIFIWFSREWETADLTSLPTTIIEAASRWRLKRITKFLPVTLLTNANPNRKKNNLIQDFMIRIETLGNLFPLCLKPPALLRNPQCRQTTRR